jgi:hypothetical protein
LTAHNRLPAAALCTLAVLDLVLGRHSHGVGDLLRFDHSSPNFISPRICGHVLKFADYTARLVAPDFQGPPE